MVSPPPPSSALAPFSSRRLFPLTPCLASAPLSLTASEEEDASAAPTRPKPKATTSSTSVSSAGGEGKEKKPMQKVEKKPVGKKPSGQASISSFFGKKSA